MENVSVYNEEDLIDHESACGIIFNDSLQLCTLFSNKYNKYTFPGGKRNEDENIECCLRRELQEEIGIDIDSQLNLFRIDRDYERDGKIVKVSIEVFLITQYQGIPMNNEDHKHDRMEWLDIATLNNLEDELKCDNIKEFINHLTNPEVINNIKLLRTEMKSKSNE